MAIQIGTKRLKKVMLNNKVLKKVCVGLTTIWQNIIKVDLSEIVKVPSSKNTESMDYEAGNDHLVYVVKPYYAGKYYPNMFSIDLQKYGGDFSKISFDFSLSWYAHQCPGFHLGIGNSISTATYLSPSFGVRWDGYYRRLYLETTVNGSIVSSQVYNVDGFPNGVMHHVEITDTLATITNLKTNVIVYSKEIVADVSSYRYFRWQGCSINTEDTPKSDVSGIVKNVLIE